MQVPIAKASVPLDNKLLASLPRDHFDRLLGDTPLAPRTDKAHRLVSEVGSQIPGRSAGSDFRH